MPFSQGLQLLQGLNSSEYKIKGNAFVLDGSSGTKIKSAAIAADVMDRGIITSTSEYA